MAKKKTTGRQVKATTGNSRADRALKRVSMSWTAKFAVWLVITAALAVSMLFAPKIEAAMFPATAPGEIVTTEGELAVKFLDVGQGDCTLIRLPDNKTMIIDGGDTDAKGAILEAIPEMFGNQFEAFDYCILTHTDSDHSGSLDDVLNAYPARTVYRPNVISTREGFVDPAIAITETESRDDNEQFWWVDAGGANLTTGTAILDAMRAKPANSGKDTVAYKNFVDAAYNSANKSKLGAEPKVLISDGRRETRPNGKAFTDIAGDVDGDGTDDYFVKFWSPLKPWYTDWNDCSNILTIEYNGQTIMLTGDAEKGSEETFVETYASQKSAFSADVLKLGHHGSRTSSSEAFLKLVLDSDISHVYTVVSCGDGNSYGHPHEETLTRVKNLGVAEDHILRTDRLTDGAKAIPMTVDAEGLHVNGTITKPSDPVGEEAPVKWWYIALGIEGLTVVAVFFLVKTKKPKKSEPKKNNSRAA